MKVGWLFGFLCGTGCRNPSVLYRKFARFGTTKDDTGNRVVHFSSSGTDVGGCGNRPKLTNFDAGNLSVQLNLFKSHFDFSHVIPDSR